MRLIKMLSLGIVAAIAATAFVGAGSASALPTALCNADPTGAKCNAGTELSGLVNIDGLQILGVGTLLTSLGNIHCQGGHIKAHIPNASLAASSLLGVINEFVYLTCEALLFGCNGFPATVTTTAKPEFHLLYTAPGLGDLTILKPSTKVEIKCGIGTITCNFAENDTVLGQVHNLHESKANGIVLFAKALITGPGGGLCPKHGELDATYKLNYLDGVTEKLVFIAT